VTGRHSIELPVAGPGDHFPSPAFHGVGGRAASLTHKKKKKKKKSGTKWRQGQCVSGIYTEAVMWGLCERGGTEVEAKRN